MSIIYWCHWDWKCLLTAQPVRSCLVFLIAFCSFFLPSFTQQIFVDYLVYARPVLGASKHNGQILCPVELTFWLRKMDNKYVTNNVIFNKCCEDK